MKFNTTFFRTTRRILVFALLMLTAQTALAFRGGSPLELHWLAANSIREVTSTTNGNDGIWVAWIQDNADTGNDEVMLRRISSTGFFSSFPILVSSSVQTITGLNMVADPGNPGTVYLAWSDYSSDTGTEVQPRLFIGKYGVDTHDWTVEQSTVTGSAKARPKMVVVSGDVIVAWVDSRTGNADIYAQRLNTLDGSPAWNEVAVATGTALQQNISLTTGSGGNDVFIGFTEETTDVRVRAHKLKSASGALEGPVGGQILNTEVAGEIALDPVLLPDGAGGFYAAWHQGVHLQDVTVYLSHWGSSLNSISPGVVSIVNTNKNRDQVNLSVASDGGYGVVLAWMDGRNGSDDIYASRVNSLLQQIWVSGGVKVASSGSGVQASLPSIIGSGGGAYVSYSSLDTSGDSRLFTSYIAPNTTSEPATGFPTSVAGNGTVTDKPAVLVPTAGGIIATWHGENTLATTDPYKIFAQIFIGDVWTTHIAPPTAVSPTNGAQIPAGSAFTLEASDFEIVGGGTLDFAEVSINRSSDDSAVRSGWPFLGGVTSFPVSAAESAQYFTANESYYWSVRYYASNSEISEWSAPAEFFVASTSPSITVLADQSVDLTAGETEATQSFTLTDPDGNVDDVTVTATSNKQDTIADVDITISGSGATRSITVNPLSTGGGDAVITVTATDSDALSATTQFTVHVTSAPRIEGVQDITIDFTQTTMATLTLQIIDPDAPDLDGLRFAADISNTSVVPTSGFVIVQPTFVGGPTQLQITAAATGSANITLNVTDANGHTSTADFTITVANGADKPANSGTGGGGGGGGAIGPLLALILFGVGMLRRRVSAAN